MVQTMQAWLLKQDHHKRFDHPVFEPVFLGIESEWHYRGQVVPSNENVTVEIEVLDEQIEHDHVLLQCVSRYWVDGLKIYEVPRIGIRIKAAERKPAPEDSWILSIEENPWIKDHCPTYVLPCMPMMGELDMLIFATQKRYHQNVAEVRDLRAVNWLRFEEDTRHGRYAFEEKGHAVLARLLLEDGEVAAEAEMHFEVADMLPYQLETLQNPIRRDLPYPDGTFHGPSFQLMTEWRLGTNGASASIQVESRGVPVNAAHPSLLDASLHCIPHDNLTQWDPSVPADQVAYPIRLNRMRFFAPWPKSGSVKVEARYCGLEFNTFPKFRVVFHGPDQNVLADYELLETLLPLGHLGAADGAARRRYLHFKAHVPGLSLAREDRSGRLALNHEDLARVDWLPGTLKRIYGIDQLDPKVVLQKEVVSSAIGLHPKDVCFDAASTCRNLPFNPCASEIIDGTTLSGDKLTPPVLDTKIVDRYWERRGAADSALLCVTSALCGAFVRRVILQDPDDFAAQDAVLFLANHQVGVESLLFLSLMAVLKDQNMLAVAKAEHRDTWVGAVLESAIKIFGDPPLEPIYFQRERQKSFVNIMKKLTAQKDKKSVLIHVEGTRARQAGVPVRRATSLLADLSMRGAMPIVPVRFVGGLNTGKTEKSLEFPYRYGMQDIYVGRSIRPDTLSDMTLKERKACIVDSINLLGPPLETEAPIQGRIDASSIQARLADGWKAFPAVVAAAMELSSSHRMLERLNRIGVGLGATDLFALLQQQIHPTVA
jgi:1-acyl-sn-glycerol-3-phosphate acyltransferase